MSARIEPVPFPFPEGREFDEIIDVRSPSEFAEDHLTDAINLPVLTNEERRLVGTHYAMDRFEARKLGAALVSRNIAGHIERHFASKAKDYRPAIYCWRGGQRSQSLATILSEIGWCTAVIQGGYKAYRRQVQQTLAETPERLHLRIVHGLTGSGKTRIIRTLEALGAQVLNLEQMACHKGSVFGGEPAQPQPTQKRFESLLFDRISQCSPDRPVFVEAESPKIGRLGIPAPLWRRMRESEVIEIQSQLPDRVAYLQSDYQSWIVDSQRILSTIDLLRPFHSAAQIHQWESWCRQEQWAPLIESLLVDHYDRRYGVAPGGYYETPSLRFELSDLSDASLSRCASAILNELNINR